MDTEEIEVFKTRFQKWCKKNEIDGVAADEDALKEVGLLLETKHFFDVYGLVVSERRIVDNVDGFNIFVSIAMQLLIVLAQLVLVFLPPIILIAAFFGQQQIHKVRGSVRQIYSRCIARIGHSKRNPVPSYSDSRLAG